MDCPLIRSELVGYHFGTLDDRAREGVEAHLLECTDCLRAFMRLKARVEQGAVGERPSEAARLRLRDDVLATFPRAKAARSIRAPAVWRRPVPLYQSLVVAAVAVLIAKAAPSWVERVTRGSASDVAEHYVDTSRTLPGSLNIY